MCEDLLVPINCQHSHSNCDKDQNRWNRGEASFTTAVISLPSLTVQGLLNTSFLHLLNHNSNPIHKVATQSCHSRQRWVRQTNHSIMRLYLQVSLSIMATFTHMVLVLGLKCSSGCAACWKDNDLSGTDTKFSCSGDCGSTCPPGYHGIHCAKYSRCV